MSPVRARAVLRRAERLYSSREISRAIKRMAAELSPRLADANPVVLAVMYGGAFTALELCRRFDFPHEFDYVHPTSYVQSEVGGEIKWRARPARRLAGRTVLVVDDILDRGRTLHALHEELDSVGVATRLTAVLVRKRVARRERRPRVDVFGVDVDDVYVFGCGMDYRGYWRSLRGVYSLGSEP